MTPRPSGPVSLSPRELEVLRLIGTGRSSQAVADLLLKAGADFHLGGAFSKLNVTNRLHAVQSAKRLGILG